MIKAILFDFDGVLTVEKTGSGPITKYISKRCGIDLKTIEDNYYKYNDALLGGQTTHEEIWGDFCKGVGENIDYNILLEAFPQITLDNKVVSYIKELKKKYLTAMVTDNKCDRIDSIVKYYNLEQCFDFITISAAVHSRKKEEHIFKYTVEKLKVSPEECIFIDNTSSNLVVPKNMGMKVIKFDDENRDIEKFKEEVEGMLL